MSVGLHNMRVSSMYGRTRLQLHDTNLPAAVDISAGILEAEDGCVAELAFSRVEVKEEEAQLLIRVLVINLILKHESVEQARERKMSLLLHYQSDVFVPGVFLGHLGEFESQEFLVNFQ